MKKKKLKYSPYAPPTFAPWHMVVAIFLIGTILYGLFFHSDDKSDFKYAPGACLLAKGYDFIQITAQIANVDGDVVTLEYEYTPMESEYGDVTSPLKNRWYLNYKYDSGMTFRESAAFLDGIATKIPCVQEDL